MNNNKPKDNNVNAFALAGINAFMLAGMSLFVKLLSVYFGPIEVTFLRNIFSLLLVGTFLICAKKLWVLKTSRPWAHLFRSAIGTGGIILGAWALSILPLTVTTVLLFTSPLFTVLLAIPFLGERPGIFRIMAVLFGFSGVVILAWPLGSLPLLGLLLGLAWGFTSGCVDVTLRWLGSTENSYTTVFYFLLFGTVTTALHWPMAQANLPDLNWTIIWIIIGLGITGTGALLAKTQSYRLGEASLVAPIMYTMLIWTLLFDYFIWGKTPQMNVIAGAAIIIASNSFILYRENKARTNPTEAEVLL